MGSEGLVLTRSGLPYRALLPSRDTFCLSLPRGNPEPTGRHSVPQGLPGLPCREVLSWGGQWVA